MEAVAVNPENVALIGIRDIDAGERKIINDSGIHAFTMREIDEHGMALLVYEDIYLTLYRTDGPKAAFQLRQRVLDRYKQGRGLDCHRNDLKGYDIWETPQNRQRLHNKNSQMNTTTTNHYPLPGGLGLPPSPPHPQSPQTRPPKP